jgi:hypothetical protein
MEIYEFLKDVGEINRAREIALRYAASILEDFSNLTPKGRKVMAEDKDIGDVHWIIVLIKIYDIEPVGGIQ